jgi:hypothetical protein
MAEILITADELVAGDIMLDANGPLRIEHIARMENGTVRVFVADAEGEDEWAQTWTFATSDLCRVQL